MISLNKNHEIDFVNGNISKGILTFVIPVIITNIIQMFYNAADMIVVGRYAGDISLAAVGATGAVSGLIINLFLGFSVGVSSTVSRYIGANDKEKTSNAVHSAIAMSLLIGLVIGILGIFTSKFMLIEMSTPENVIDPATLYMQIIFAGVPANLLYNFGASILRSIGDTRRPMIFLTSSGLINVGFNLLFVIVFDMNVAGVALATIISQYISAALVMITLIRTDTTCKFEIKKLRFHAEQVKLIIFIGLPAGIQTCTYSLSNILIQSSVNSFGSKAMSGFTAAANILSFINTATDAFATTAITYSAQNFGAKRYDRILKSTNICIAVSTIMGTVLGYLYYVFGVPLIGIYAPGNSEVAMYGMKYVIMFKYVAGFAAINGVATSALRGIGKSTLPMLVSIGGICVFRIIWILTLFPVHHSLETLYISYPISWVGTALINAVIFYFAIHKLKKNDEREAPSECTTA